MGCPLDNNYSSYEVCSATFRKEHGELFLSSSNGLMDRGRCRRQRRTIAVGEGKARGRMGMNSSKDGSAVAAKLGNTDEVGWQALLVADKPPCEDNIGCVISW